MRYYLTSGTALKWLESLSVFHVERDELYELDDESFGFLRSCATADGCEGGDQAFIEYCLAEGLLTEQPGSQPRPAVVPAPTPSLRYLELQITDRCNLRCRHCYIGEQTGNELSAGRVRTVLNEFEEMQGLRVLLTGGEPLLHSRFDEINEMLSGRSLHTVLFTNGKLLTPARLKKLTVHEIQLSIDGMEEGHDALRGRGSWSAAMLALRSAIDAGFRVAVSTMVHRVNRGDFDEMNALFRSLGVQEWNVDVPCTAGRFKNDRTLSLPPREGGRYLAYGYGGGMHGSGEGYGCGLHLMAVLPDGTAAKCTFYGDRPAGNINEGLRSCWARVRPVRLEDLACSCDHLAACRGGCRFRAELLEGPRGRDLYRCALYGCIDKSE
jgi:radical SAM protein with 4Fe4S-binding SPASM domain